VIASVPNGHALSKVKRNAAILTSMGMRAGAGDLVITGHNFSGWIEVKSDVGKQSKAQREFEADCRGRGINYGLARDVDGALALAVQWGIAQRGSDGALRCVRPLGLASLA
jgi:hypothetical protein